MKIFLLLSFVFLSLTVQAESVLEDSCSDIDYSWEKSQKGWYWFEDPKQVNQAPKKIWRDLNIMTTPEINEEMEFTYKEFSKEPKNRDIDLLRRHLKLKKELLSRGTEVTKEMANLLISEPELSFSEREIPSTQLGREMSHQAAQEENTKKIKEKIKNKEIGLIFFYRSTCPYSQKYAQILKRVVTELNIPVIAVSEDYKALPEFKKFKPNTGQIQTLGITRYPTTLLFFTKEKSYEVIGEGLMTGDVVIESIATKIKIHDQIKYHQAGK